ncbi:MAG: hypothetical protein ACUVXF_08335 [Desulfobaccales bacterium]
MLGILWVLPGCGHWQHDLFPAPSWKPKGLATPLIINQDRVFVYPRDESLRHKRAGLLIFRTDNVVADLAPAVTLIFYQELLANRVFAELVYIPETYTKMLNTLPLAKQYKVDVLVLGEVPYYLDGGTVGTSAIQVDLKVVEAESKRLLWSYSDSVKASPRPIIDLLIVETRPYPTPAIGNLTARLAKRMAETLVEGKPPSPPRGIAAFFKGE